MNTVDECNAHSKLMSPVFEDAGRGRLWIVVGYNGESDPVFDHLAGVPRFDNMLYWIGYGDSEPAKHVSEKLLLTDKDAFYTNGFDADSFFVSLTQKLGIFPPPFIAKPFSHLGSTLQMLTPYSPPNQDSAEDVTEIAHKWIQSAVKQFEEDLSSSKRKKSRTGTAVRSLGAVAQKLLMAGKYDEVVALRQHYDRAPTEEFAELLSWAYLMQGNALLSQARTKTGDEADRLFALAAEKFQAALAIKPDMHEALNNWGSALSDQARTKTGDEFDATLDAAKQKLLQAEAIKPGVGSYNLACVSALKGKEYEAQKWLMQCQQQGQLPTREHLNQDHDLDSIRDTDWFRRFLETLRD